MRRVSTGKGCLLDVVAVVALCQGFAAFWFHIKPLPNDTAGAFRARGAAGGRELAQIKRNCRLCAGRHQIWEDGGAGSADLDPLAAIAVLRISAVRIRVSNGYTVIVPNVHGGVASTRDASYAHALDSRRLEASIKLKRKLFSGVVPRDVVDGVFSAELEVIVAD